MKNLKYCDDAYTGIEQARGRESLDMLRGAFPPGNVEVMAIDRTLGQLRQRLAQATTERARTELKNTIFITEQQKWTTDGTAQIRVLA